MAAVVINVAGNYDGKAIAQAQKALSKLGGTANKESSTVANAFGKMKSAAKGLAVGFALKQVGDGLLHAAKAAQESAAVQAITEQALKTTGAQAWTTSKQINDLSTSISNKTGIDDEAVQHAANLLLTFKDVKNAGEGQAAMFDRATSAAADLSAAGFGSLDSSAKMLGKALNDPTKGMTALSRAGVTFTEQQKAQIKSLQESGNLLGAQAIIMKEVESQVGGAAEASASPIERLKVMLGKLEEQLGAGLLPAFSAIADSLGPLMTTLAGPLGDLGSQLGVLITQLVTALEPALPPIVQLVTSLAGTLSGALGAALPPIAQALADVAVSLAPFIAKLGELVGVIVAALMPALTPLLNALAPIIDALVAGLSPIIDIVIESVKSLAPLLTLLANLLSVVIVTAIKILLPIVSKLIQAFAAFAGFIIRNVAGPVTQALGWIADAVGGLLSSLGWIPGIGDDLKAAGDAIQQFASDLPAKVGQAADAVASEGRRLGSSLADGTAAGIAASTAGGGSGGKVGQAVKDLAKVATDAATKALEPFKERVTQFFDVKQQVADSIRDVAKLSADTSSIVGPSATGIIGGLQAKLAQIKTFGKQLKDLRALGLGDAALQQIVQAGPEAGGQLAAALLAEGRSAIKTVNTLQSQISSQANAIGTTAAESATGLSAAGARGLQQTNVKFDKGSVVVNVGAGTSAADRAAINAAVQDAVTQALRSARREAGR